MLVDATKGKTGENSQNTVSHIPLHEEHCFCGLFFDC